MARPFGGAKEQRELTTKFKVIKFLGKGSFGSVFQVQRLSDGQTYALKEMDVRSMSHIEKEDSVNEVRLLASIKHPNVIAYNEAFIDGNRLCIIMEYAPDGDLTKVIKKWQMMKKPMPEDLVWKLFIQICKGLSALHQMKILHRDIKPGNIMVLAGDVAKIGDLGIAKLLTHQAAAKTQIGTPHYMPAEIWKARPYSFSSDVWAMGCLLYELATGNVPFEARTMNELRNKVLKGTYPPISSMYSRELQDLVKACLDQVPEKRPTIDKILALPCVATRLRLLPDQAQQPPPTAGSNLLSTIKVPKGNFAAVKGQLPPASYDSEFKDIMGRPPPASRPPGLPEIKEVEQLPRLPAGPAGGGGGLAGGYGGGGYNAPVAGQQQQQKAVAFGGFQVPQPAKTPAAYMYQPNGGYPGAGAGAGGFPRVPGARPPPLFGPGAVQPPRAGSGWPGAAPSAAPSPSAASVLSRYPIQSKPPPGVAVRHASVSESHAAYGAFYNNSPKAAAAAAAKPRLYQDIKAYAAANNKPWSGAVAAPNIPGFNRPIPPAGLGGMARPPGMGAAAGGAVGGAGGGGKGWNYGVGAGARAAAAAYVAGGQNKAQYGAGGPGGGYQARVPSYAPSQWNGKGQQRRY